MSDSLKTTKLSAGSAAPCSWLEAERFAGGTEAGPDVTPPITAYNIGGLDRLLWDDLPSETTYSLHFPAVSRSRAGRPVLPFLIEDFLTHRSCRTAGDLAETIGMSSLAVSQVGVAAVGTRYDVIVSFLDENLLNPPAVASAAEIEVAEENPAKDLRELTELPVERLADVFGVSRVTYYNWMSDKPISLDNLARLRTIVALLKQVRSLLRVDTRDFGRWLIAPVGPSGESPFDFLRDGADARVRSLALRIPSPPRATPRGVSDESIRRSGVTRASMRRIGSRGWADEVKADTIADRLEQLSPSLQHEVDFSDAVSDDAETGWGVFHP
jgi:transcriptional regulator with XRE-family HTH domain